MAPGLVEHSHLRPREESVVVNLTGAPCDLVVGEVAAEWIGDRAPLLWREHNHLAVLLAGPGISICPSEPDGAAL
jgi:hypothetical protein